MDDRCTRSFDDDVMVCLRPIDLVPTLQTCGSLQLAREIFLRQSVPRSRTHV